MLICNCRALRRQYDFSASVGSNIYVAIFEQLPSSQHLRVRYGPYGRLGRVSPVRHFRGFGTHRLNEVSSIAILVLKLARKRRACKSFHTIGRFYLNILSITGDTDGLCADELGAWLCIGDQPF